VYGTISLEEVASHYSINKTVESNTMKIEFKNSGKSIARWTGKGDWFTTAIPGLSLFRRDEPTQPQSIIDEPRVCMITQGAKRVLLGDEM
jgi:hypothetical protein